MKESVWYGGILAAVVLAGCATTGDPRDPLEPLNRKFYTFNDTLDRYVMRPVAETYQKVTPQFVDDAVSHFFDNIEDISVTVNNFLQGDFEEGVEDLARFFVNTTVGLGGLVDVASEIGLEKHQEDFGQTLAVWGVPPGPYLVVPFIGPRTVRHAVGDVAGGFANPLNYTTWPIRLSTATLETIDSRADLLDETAIMERAALDPYEFLRNAYFQRREYLIHNGEVPLDHEFEAFEKELEALEEEMDQESGSPAKSGTASP